MNGIISSLLGAASQGVIWGLMALGVYITYKILNIADLTVDGSFALGGCVCALLVATFKFNPIIALLIAFITGALAGIVTGILHALLKIPAILAGILTQVSLWSINLWILGGGKSNLPLLKNQTIFTYLSKLLNTKNSTVALIIGIIIGILVIVSLYWFFGTELGSVIRATGNNEKMMGAEGVNTGIIKIIGLSISNGLVALSGALICQSQKFADISMGTGAIVIGLASIVIGEILFIWCKSFGFKLLSVIIGCIIYFIIRAIVLFFGLDSDNMKLISAIIIAIALAVPTVIDNIKSLLYYKTGE